MAKSMTTWAWCLVFSQKMMKIDITSCTKQITKTFPEILMKTPSTPASNHLFKIQPNEARKGLQEEQVQLFTALVSVYQG
jgi:hypothetical protein